MIRKRPWFSRLFRPVVRHSLRRGLDGVFVQGLATLQAALARGPVIVAPTHVAYWDAMVILHLESALGADGYALMDEANLRRLPFFGWLGAIPVDRTRPGRNRGPLKAAVSVLDRPGRLLYVFPQGRQRPAHLRPLGLEPGVYMVARRTVAPVVPLALTYHFREAAQPTACLDVGPPLTAGADRSGFLSELEAALVAGLTRIDDWIEHGRGAFEALEPARQSSPGVGTRLLSEAIRRTGAGGRADG